MHTIVLLALLAEAPDLASQPNVFFTGVGKVNAAIVASKLISEHQPTTVINFGTAGGITVQSGLHSCTRFVQRDMNCQALGFAPGVTPFESVTEIAISNQGLVCATGDSFVTGEPLLVAADLVDMEAYAMAKACQYHNVEFLCWKYISDQADQAAHNDWNNQVSAGQSHYIQKLKQLNLIR
jgi:adenosylhomocysteine nucleosidase